MLPDLSKFTTVQRRPKGAAGRRRFETPLAEYKPIAPMSLDELRAQVARASKSAPDSRRIALTPKARELLMSLRIKNDQKWSEVSRGKDAAKLANIMNVIAQKQVISMKLGSYYVADPFETMHESGYREAVNSAEMTYKILTELESSPHHGR